MMHYIVLNTHKEGINKAMAETQASSIARFKVGGSIKFQEVSSWVHSSRINPRFPEGLCSEKGEASSNSNRDTSEVREASSNSNRDYQ